MVILDADRFGLAQLHQLRGRVGRGEAQAYCILVSDSNDETAKARLDALATTNDGFVLAELDLELRREGELLGLHQSGLPTLRIASLRNKEDRERAAQARAMAERLLDERGALLAAMTPRDGASERLACPGGRGRGAGGSRGRGRDGRRRGGAGGVRMSEAGRVIAGPPGAPG